MCGEQREHPPLAKQEPFNRAESGTCSKVLLPDAKRGRARLDATEEAGITGQD